MAKVKTPKTGLSTKHWIGYMLGDWGGCMTFALMGSFVTRYYTNVLRATLLFWQHCWQSGTSGTPSMTP